MPDLLSSRCGPRNGGVFHFFDRLLSSHLLDPVLAAPASLLRKALCHAADSDGPSFSFSPFFAYVDTTGQFVHPL